MARSTFYFGFGWHCLDRWQRLSHSTSSKASACYQFTLGFNASFSGKSIKFFVDTADVSEIRKLNELGIVDGVTTHPTLIAKSGRPIREVLAEICDLVDGPV